MIEFRADKDSLKNLNDSVVKNILLPKLDEINLAIQKDIAKSAKAFKGVSNPSLSNVMATKAKVKRKQLRSQIRPVEDKALAFWINRKGYDQIQLVDVSNDTGLKNWVSAKYNGGDKQAILDGRKKLRIRSREFKDALGSAERDFFGKAFENVVRSPGRFGLK